MADTESTEPTVPHVINAQLSIQMTINKEHHLHPFLNADTDCIPMETVSQM